MGSQNAFAKRGFSLSIKYDWEESNAVCGQLSVLTKQNIIPSKESSHRAGNLCIFLRKYLRVNLIPSSIHMRHGPTSGHKCKHRTEDAIFWAENWKTAVWVHGYGEDNPPTESGDGGQACGRTLLKLLEKVQCCCWRCSAPWTLKASSQHSPVTCHCPSHNLSWTGSWIFRGKAIHFQYSRSANIFQEIEWQHIIWNGRYFPHFFPLFFLDTFLTYVWFHHFLRCENIIGGAARTPAQQNTQKQATEAHCLGCGPFFYFSICWSMELGMRQSVCHPES